MLKKILLILCIMTVASCGCTSSSSPSGSSSTPGVISIQSTPASAEIYFTGEYRGTTPGELRNVNPGSYTIELRKSGYETWRSQVTVTAGSTSYVSASLAPVYTPIPTPPPPQSTAAIRSVSPTPTTTHLSYGFVSALSTPSGAEVYLDGEYKGTTPVTIGYVSSGLHSLEYRRSCYETWKTQISVNAGETYYSSKELVDICTTVPTTTAISYWLHIDSISNKYVGDTFRITGSTNFDPGKGILISVYPATIQGGSFSGASGTVKVQPGLGSYNTFYYDLDTSTFNPGQYIVKAEAYQPTTSTSTTFILAGFTRTKSVAATARQVGNNVVVTWQGGQDNSLVTSYTVIIWGTYTFPGYAPTVGASTTFNNAGTSGQDHIVVVAYFTDGSSQVILDTYV